MAEAQGKAPAQVHYDEHWDRAIDLTVRRAVYGTLAGGIAAVLLASECRPLSSPIATALCLGL